MKLTWKHIVPVCLLSALLLCSVWKITRKNSGYVKEQESLRKVTKSPDNNIAKNELNPDNLITVDPTAYKNNAENIYDVTQEEQDNKNNENKESITNGSGDETNINEIEVEKKSPSEIEISESTLFELLELDNIDFKSNILLKSILDLKLGLDYKDSKKGYTPLMMAILKRNKFMINILVEKGASCSGKREWLNALRNLDVNSLKKLQEVCEIYFLTPQGNTLLQLAIQYSQEDFALSLLIETHINIHNRNKNNEDAFMMAMFNSLYKVAKQLLNKGIDVVRKNIYDESILKMATVPNDKEQQKLLDESITEALFNHLDETNKTIRTEHINALLRNNTKDEDIWAELNNYGTEQPINPNLLFEYNEPILFKIVRKKYYKSAELVLQLGANPNMLSTVTGTSTMIIAARNNDFDMVRLLQLNHGDLSVINKQGESVLFYAIKYKNKELIKTIIERNECGFENRKKLLKQAIAINEPSIVESLLTCFNEESISDYNIPYDKISNSIAEILLKYEDAIEQKKNNNIVNDNNTLSVINEVDNSESFNATNSADEVIPTDDNNSDENAKYGINLHKTGYIFFQ